MLKLSSLILEIDPQPTEDNVDVSPEVVYPLYIKVRNKIGWDDKKLTELREKYGFNKDYYDSIRTWIFSIHQQYLDQMYQDLLKINGGELEEIKAMSNIDVKTVANLYWDILDRYKIGSVQSGKLVDIITKYGWSPANNGGKSFRDFILQDMNQQQLNSLFKDLSSMPKEELGEIKSHSKITPELVHEMLNKINYYIEKKETNQGYWKFVKGLNDIMEKYRVKYPSGWAGTDEGPGFIYFLPEVHLKKLYKELIEYYNQITNK